jgi:hypothetical protein
MMEEIPLRFEDKDIVCVEALLEFAMRNEG